MQQLDGARDFDFEIGAFDLEKLAATQVERALDCVAAFGNPFRWKSIPNWGLQTALEGEFYRSSEGGRRVFERFRPSSGHDLARLGDRFRFGPQ